MSYQCHRVNSSSHSFNGNVAIQWEWSNFDPSQNPNPLTDYDKTLHNCLRPRDEHVTQNLCQSAVTERLAKYVKYKASFFIFIFSRTRLLKWPSHGILLTIVQNTRCDVRKCLLRVHTMADNILGFKFHKTVKNGLLQACSSIRERTQGEWRHRKLTSLACSRSQPSGVYYL